MTDPVSVHTHALLRVGVAESTDNNVFNESL